MLARTLKTSLLGFLLTTLSCRHTPEVHLVALGLKGQPLRCQLVSANSPQPLLLIREAEAPGLISSQPTCGQHTLILGVADACGLPWKVNLLPDYRQQTVVDRQVRTRFGRRINDYNHHNRTPLLEAVANEDEAAVRLLLKHPQLEINKGEINKHGTESLTALMVAARQGNLQLVKLLVSHGADININYFAVEAELQPGRRCLGEGHSTDTYQHHVKWNCNAIYYAREGKEALQAGGKNASAYIAVERYLEQQGAIAIPWETTYFDQAYYHSEKWRTNQCVAPKEGRERLVKIEVSVPAQP